MDRIRIVRDWRPFLYQIENEFKELPLIDPTKSHNYDGHEERMDAHSERFHREVAILRAIGKALKHRTPDSEYNWHIEDTLSATEADRWLDLFNAMPEDWQNELLEDAK